MFKKKRAEELNEAYSRGYRDGQKKGFEEGRAYGEKIGIELAVKGFAHMSGDYGEGKVNDDAEKR